MDFRDQAQQRLRINTDQPWANQECRRCSHEEPYKGDQAYRLAGQRIIPRDLSPTQIGWLDIQADVTCNGGCLICGPWNSTAWQSELARWGEHPPVARREDLATSLEMIFDQIDVSRLAQIQFLGGEPFLSNTDEIVIDRIPNPQHCRLKYTTNGSIWPTEARRQLWSRFQSVMINFSIDGIGDRFDYLRYPLKWKTVSDNVQRFVDSAPENILFHVNHTLTPLNIFYYHEFIDWIEKTFPGKNFLGVHAHAAYGIMGIENSSIKLRKLIRSKYGDHLMCKILAKAPMIDNDRFWQYIRLWDQRRNLDWRQIFPDIVDHV